MNLYREFMQDITNGDRTGKMMIITDLLSLVKMDQTAPDLNIMAVNVNELLELILKRLKPIAAEEECGSGSGKLPSGDGRIG